MPLALARSSVALADLRWCYEWNGRRFSVRNNWQVEPARLERVFDPLVIAAERAVLADAHVCRRGIDGGGRQWRLNAGASPTERTPSS